VQLRQLRDDLVEAGEHEPVELDLADRPEAADRQPHRRPDDARLGERGVEHALLAEILLQPVGHPEHPAEPPDVLAHDQHLGVALQRRPQPVVERLRHRHGGGHRAPPSTGAPSNEAAYAR